MQRLRKIWQHFQAHPARQRLWRSQWRARPRQGVVLAIGVGVLVAAFPVATHAQGIATAFESGMLTLMNGVLIAVSSTLGNILLLFIRVLVWLAQYNDFVNAPAVQTGWAVTRDLSNMFFIIALLLISIGTVFNIQEYRYSRLLPKLVAMAILINFSKTIAVFFIDLSQVVMLTFVNAFKDLAAGNLTKAIGIDQIMDFAQTSNAAGGDINLLSVLGALVAGAIMIFVALVVVGVFVILLAQRIVMLWIYIVLAPTAYMVAVLPGSLGSWWGTWWRDFTQYIVRGPVIAFFLWLAFTVMSLSTNVLIESSDPSQAFVGGGAEFQDPIFVSPATSAANVLNYIIGIGMLIAGLQQATKASGAAGNVASKWLGNLNRWGSAAANVPTDAIKGAGRFGLSAAGNRIKPLMYGASEGALGLASKLNVLGIGTAASKGLATLRQQRMKTEDKNTSSVKYLGAQQERNILLDNPATLAGKGYQKAAMENAMKTHGLAGYSDDEKMKILSAYDQRIGYTKKSKEGEPGEFIEGAIDSDGLKTRKDLFKKTPALLALLHDKAEKGSDEQIFYGKKMTDLAKSMGTAEINDMEKGDWKNKTWQKYALPELDKRMVTTNKNGEIVPSEFAKKFNRDVGANMQEAIANAGGHAIPGDGSDSDEEVLAQEDIDRRRQQRTEALQKQHGEDFETSAEYRANPSNFYSRQQYQQNARQQQRVMERLADGKAAVAEVTSLNKFSRGKSNTLAVSETLLNQAGVKATAGGYTRNPESLKRIAGVFNQQLQGDVDAIETELATLATEEKQLSSPSTKLVDASGRPMTQAQVDPQKLQDIAARRTALQARQATIQATQARLQNPEGLKDLTFINADRSGGAARNILAEEAMHKYIDTIDDDGSIRASMKAQFTPEEFQKIVSDMRQRSDHAGMSEDRAFDEYLAKGLVNNGRWADTSPDAVKLKSGIELEMKTLAQQKGGNIDFKTLEEPTFGDGPVSPAAQANFAVPKKVSPVAAGFQALGRRMVQPVAEGAQTVRRNRAVSKEINASEQKPDLEALRADFDQAEQAAQAERAALERLESASGNDVAKLRAEYDANAKVRSSTTSETTASLAATRMNELQAEIAKKAENVKNQRQVVAAAEQDVARRRTEVATQERVEKSGQTPAPTSNAASPKTQRSRPTGDIIEDAEQGGGITNVTNITNVTQNISQAFKAAPQEIRGKLNGITADVLDSALKNSIVWRGLMSYIKNNTAEIQKSEKLGDLGRTEIQKRIGSMEKHVRDGNAEEFKTEFGNLQSMFNSGSEDNN
ncbi:MAG: hypothetical protein AAB515_01295 [Patescibacteria group bacterium]